MFAADAIRCMRRDTGAGVSFVGTSDTRFITTTSITETIPAQVVDGDLLISSVMHRDVLTPPSGWTLLYTVNVVDSNQQLSIYHRDAISADAGAPSTWVQAATDRMSVNISAYRGGAILSNASGPIGISSGVIAMPTIPTSGGQIVVSVCISVYAATISKNTLEVSSGWSQITPSSSTDSANQIRLGVAYTTSEISGDWTFNFAQSYSNAGIVHNIRIG